jgi:hypothetical protein
MKVEYEGSVYDMDLEEITVRQAKVIKTKCGLSLKGLEDSLQEGDADGLRALFWLMLENSGEHVDIDSVDFKIVKFANAVQAASKAEAEARRAVPAPKAAATKSPKPVVSATKR